MYSAISIAQSISKHFFLKKKQSFSESELQAYLFQIQKEAYRQTGKPLISGQFLAGPDGPFIQEVCGMSITDLCQEPCEMDDASWRIISKALSTAQCPSTKNHAWQKARVPLSSASMSVYPIEEQWIKDEVNMDNLRSDVIGYRP